VKKMFTFLLAILLAILFTSTTVFAASANITVTGTFNGAEPSIDVVVSPTTLAMSVDAGTRKTYDISVSNTVYSQVPVRVDIANVKIVADGGFVRDYNTDENTTEAKKFNACVYSPELGRYYFHDSADTVDVVHASDSFKAEQGIFEYMTSNRTLFTLNPGETKNFQLIMSLSKATFTSASISGIIELDIVPLV